MGGVPLGAPPGGRSRGDVVSHPSQLLRSPWHLAKRFFWSLRDVPTDPADDAWAESYLLPGEVALWRRMSDLDRRHSVIVARRFLAARPAATRAEMAGALLHDVGKIESGLGVWGRVTASLIGGRTARFRSYLDHERIGAELAAAAGSDPDTVELIAERGPAYPVLQSVDGV